MRFTVAKLGVKEVFVIEVDKINFREVRSALESERNRFIDKLREYKSAGIINSLSKPLNKPLQKELDDIVDKKRILKNSVEQINKIFL